MITTDPSSEAFLSDDFCRVVMISELQSHSVGSVLSLLIQDYSADISLDSQTLTMIHSLASLSYSLTGCHRHLLIFLDIISGSWGSLSYLETLAEICSNVDSQSVLALTLECD